jgi:hypothetical protein
MSSASFEATPNAPDERYEIASASWKLIGLVVERVAGESRR